MPTHPFARTGRPRHGDVLTPAEWEVLGGVRDGLSNGEIALRRGCSLETVRFHLRNLREKLDLKSRDALRSFPGRPAPERKQAREATSHRLLEQIPLVQVRDMAHSLAFYRDALGFELVSCWPEGNDEPPGWAALAAGAARMMLRQGHPRRAVDHGPGRAGTVIMNFYVDGVDALHKSLVEAGHRCGEVHALFYGAREFDLLDPDGNELAIVEFAASTPTYLASEPRRKS